MATQDLTVRSNWVKLYRMCESIYGRETNELDISRAFLRYLHVTGQKERS